MKRLTRSETTPSIRMCEKSRLTVFRGEPIVAAERRARRQTAWMEISMPPARITDHVSCHRVSQTLSAADALEAAVPPLNVCRANGSIDSTHATRRDASGEWPERGRRTRHFASVSPNKCTCLGNSRGLFADVCAETHAEFSIRCRSTACELGQGNFGDVGYQSAKKGTRQRQGHTAHECRGTRARQIHGDPGTRCGADLVGSLYDFSATAIEDTLVFQRPPP